MDRQAGVLPVADDYRQLRLRYDSRHRALWYYLLPRARPCFNSDLLRELRRFQTEVVQVNSSALERGTALPIRYTVLASGVRGVFNLGGDLELFARMIQKQDRDGLLSYATECIDVLYPNAVAFHQPVTTLSLVQGDALAGGFEAAISSNVVIAERSARFGLPEVLFNLIPGMGAYSFLIRRVSPDIAKELILSGEMISAERMRELRLVDVVVDDGQGEAAVDDYLAQHFKRANAHAALDRVRNLVNPVTYDELIAITRIWVDAALQLTGRDLRVISQIVKAQDRCFVANQASRELKATS
ncbi:MAG TPA: crotonase/enoyl-CoA hydratase family protein [Candidatus Krumholzibacteria bacterium]|nr:crotonase/enoyl-CoA hydratase family protein [Candidatus Krumholzibacteria bacterium]HPD70149.1 crotonase/enoyl-CoA hydratase family protein [Candidatus Krumholzibacteria bacterium]HRY40151.1 crotonase/enoyl-CoA hydratase family protein [Candidatus Krumholzibacteria bacterium]